MVDWTVTTPRFEQTYRDIVVADIKRQLSPLFVPDELAEEDIAYALSVASRLALAGSGSTTESAEAARKAYDVAIRTVGLGNGSGRAFRGASELILGRLGNFPARTLLRERYPSADEPLPTLSALEILAREFENRAVHGSAITVLTDFQVRLLHALESSRYVSVSAPTSAGKSFTLELEIARQMRRGVGYRVAYLVPTRALIRQVTYDLVQLVRGTDLQAVPILSVPSPPEDAGQDQRMVYVLTQERFANLLAAGGDKLKLDAVIVDEAQGIAEEDRGQTLEAVVDDALARFPDAKVFFSSPLKSNPEYLLKLFSKQADTESFVEYMTPVSQNIVNVYPVKGQGKTALARFEVLLGTESITVGMVNLPFKFRKPYLQKFAIALTKPGDTSIVYCNDPSTADRTATAIAAELGADTADDPDITDLVDFLRDHIHSQYRLANVLERGVAFHYGNIPQIIRARIEELLRDRILQFVCCTSTLLQGMNLPARNLFVENPKKGRGNPMLPGDFWNLVGRAGRMAKEFVGNVYCIHGADWESEPFKAPKLDPIKSAFATAVTDRVDEVNEIAIAPPVSSESDQAWAEQVVARVYGQFTRKRRRIAESRFATPGNRSALVALDESLVEFSRGQTLPDSIFEQNLYLHPARLEHLALRFRAGDPAEWIPPNPNSARSYNRLLPMFQVLEDLFFRTGFQSYRYDTFLALQWMQGATLKELIVNKIKWNNAEGDADRINDLIRDLFDDVENKLRYRYVKYMKVYTDVLHAVLIQEGRADEAERVPPIHLYLEYGAANVTLISLIALGLSHTSAILLKGVVRMRDDLSPTRCQEIIETIDVAQANLPAICRAEITRLRRRT